MKTTDASSKPYHHGHLKDALIDAAEALLEEEGIDKLSLRAAARRSGVSQAAPYSHFSNRASLLAAVATRGFDRLTAYMRPPEQLDCDSATRIRLLGRAYVAFALDYPMLFRLMFSSQLCAVDDASFRAACDRSYEPIQAAVADEAAVKGAQGYVADASLAAWALVHGLATLVIEGKQPWPASAESRDALVDRVVSVYSVAAMRDSR